MTGRSVTWQILIQSDVEPYETITRLLDEADCQLHWCRDVDPPPEADYAPIDVISTSGSLPLTPDLIQLSVPPAVVTHLGDV